MSGPVSQPAEPGSRSRILRAATAEFARVGLAGARVDRIADDAGINKQRVYAYFGSKAALFDAAVAEGFRQLRADVPIADGPGDLVDYALRLYDFHVGNPALSRLLLWEQLERPLLDSTKRPDHHDGRVADYVKGLGDNDTDDVVRLSLVLVSMAAWPAANRQVVMDVTATDSRSVQDLLEGSMRETVANAARAVIDEWRGRSGARRE
ncbi:TetR family transcriptional regulator [Rhodococcus rhodnii LMG 5362]|uniref:TetR family transcriptional regulator n=1 Tax=Rhodococcus rhodnii LMG 5362 TaxID=1273125 RepID=R7WR09_9NOCA|nr:TetR family transcriptional regulator [Rhodococcus rhodnii LMG 5362]